MNLSTFLGGGGSRLHLWVLPCAVVTFVRVIRIMDCVFL